MLNKNEIKKLIEDKKLLEGYMSLDKQLTPNGVDLTVAKISKFKKAGLLDFSNKERVISEAEEIIPDKKNKEDKYGWWELQPGTYKVKTNEAVNLPTDLIALAFSRTSILRMGCFTAHGVWDAGFSGRGEFTLTVQNPEGIKVKQNARIAQLIFYKIGETEGYDGIFKNIE